MRRRSRSCVVLAAVLVLSLGAMQASATSEQPAGTPWTRLDGDQATAGVDDPGSTAVPPPATVPPDDEIQRLPWDVVDCDVVTVPVADRDLRAWCASPVTFGCAEGTAAVTPMKYRTRPRGSTAAEWSGWRLLVGPCVPVREPRDDLDEAVARELRSVKIPAKQARIAPVTSWFAIQTPMTYFTDPGLERMTVTVLGTAVELELTPATFAWDPGDGSPVIVTAEPGAAYPDQTTTHSYTRKGTYRVTLTVTWTGRFRVVGTDGWRPIDGTGQTRHTSEPFEIREIRSVLS